jgi:hypothetical protein
VSLALLITFFPGVVDTGQNNQKSGVNDTAEKLFIGVNDRHNDKILLPISACLHLKMKNDINYM